MLKEDYSKIMNCLDERISQCSNRLDKIVDSSSIESLSIAEAKELKKFCVDEVATMTRICMVDLYHIIGMGNLTGVQMTKFISKFKKYVSYRPDIKKISKHLASFDDIPKLPSKTRFRLLELGGVVLESLLRDGVNSDEVDLDEETVDDYKSHKYFTLDLDDKGEVMTIKEEDLENFLAEEAKSIGLTGLKSDGIKMAAIKSSQAYGGGVWSRDATNKCYTFRATTASVKKNLKRLLVYMMS